MTYREAQTQENEELKWGGQLRAQQEDSTAAGEGSKGEGQVTRKKVTNLRPDRAFSNFLDG